MGSSTDMNAGERRAVYQDLFDAHWGAVRHHIECFVDDDEAVEEILAEVFLLAGKKLRIARPFGKVWLLRTADSLLKGRLSRPRTSARLAVAMGEGTVSSTEEADLADVVAVRNAVDGLAWRHRLMIVLRYWDDLSPVEISEYFGCSLAAGWKRLNRAREQVIVRLGVSRGGAHETR